MIDSEQIIKQLEGKIRDFSQDKNAQTVGYVESNYDGVIKITGLSTAMMGEMVKINNTTGVVLGLDEDYVSVIALEDSNHIKEGDKVTKTGTLLSINVSEELLSRVVDPLGNPQDSKPGIKKGTQMPLERIAAGVIEREPVDTPLKTGIKAIDAMIPIGRGQRELIIGDRGIGKTAIAIDAIINQKYNKKSDPVICVYVAIGQKQSTVARIINKLKEEGALSYTIVIAATAPMPASLQFLAPYAGSAVAEYFLEKGKNVLIVYDDLTKHAWAYRQISLVLKRPAGREAYPGDIFYLHSRLLERAVKLNKKNGGGSITALPIIETQAADISAYIPTNVISITDGQIFLEGNLFNIGIRPAINVGNSVSRVGGAAQTGLMKQISGKLRLELAQFRSLEAFAQFGSELDEATQKQLERGRRLSEIMKQNQFKPLEECYEAAIIWSAINGFLDDIKIEDVIRFEEELFSFIDSKPKVKELLEEGKKIVDKDEKTLIATLETFKKGFSK